MTAQALKDLLFQLADDELAIGHRDSEWLGVAPHIELDVAFSSIAQDEVGHATCYYRLLAELGAGGGSPDRLAYARPAAERRNAVLLERRNGPGHFLVNPDYDWAFTIVRHYAYDLFDAVRLEALEHSAHVPLAQAVAKIRREEKYHLLHHETWFRRLARHGGEARQRLAAGISQVWPELGGLFALGAHAEELVRTGYIAADAAGLRARWSERIRPVFADLELAYPGDPALAGRPDGRLGEHTPALDELLALLAEVYNLDPAAQW